MPSMPFRPPGPQEIAECGGPCQEHGPECCDCWVPSPDDLAEIEQNATRFCTSAYEGIKVARRALWLCGYRAALRDMGQSLGAIQPPAQRGREVP